MVWSRIRNNAEAFSARIRCGTKANNWQKYINFLQTIGHKPVILDVVKFRNDMHDHSNILKYDAKKLTMIGLKVLSPNMF